MNAIALILLLWRTSRWWFLVFGLIVAIHGLAPTALNIASGVLIRSIENSVKYGTLNERSEGTILAFAGFLIAAAASAIAGNLMQPLTHALSSRLWLDVQQSCAVVSLRANGQCGSEATRHVQDIHLVQEAEQSGIVRRAPMVLAAVVGFRMVGAGALVLLFGFRWWVPFLLLIPWHLSNKVFLKALRRGVDVDTSDDSHEQRRAEYLRSLVLGIPAAKEIKVFGLGAWLTAKYAEDWLRALGLMWRHRKSGWGAPIATSSIIISHAIVLGTLTSATLSGEIDPAKLIVFVQAVISSCALGLVGESQWWLTQANMFAERANRLNKTAKALEETLGRDGQQAGNSVSGALSIQFSDVDFSYFGQTSPVLKGLSLTVPPGQIIAIVGENGAGKSTLIKLLCGLCEPQSGSIFVGGRPPQEASGHIGMIFQDFVRYKLSLRDNVVLGCRGAGGDRIPLEEVAKDAGCEDLLRKLPKGWDTILSAEFRGGVDLSGGEWQKVALARAVASVRAGAGLLILDEPTANLDIRSETELFNRFLDFTAGVTTILVSHRLSSVRRAHRIIVLGNGCVLEDGTHDALLAMGGRYARMFRMQAARFTEAEGDTAEAEEAQAL